MTAKELMAPRYEVIGDYPNSPYKIGDIAKQNQFSESIHLTSINSRDEFGENVSTACFVDATSLDKYPQLFRKLNWWEHRTKDEMPKKLICKAIPESSDEIIEIEEWDMEIMIGWRNKSLRECASLYAFNYEYGYFPVD